MIHGVYANQKSFHPVVFTAGLNVFVAERTEASSVKDPRIVLGKSTLIEIIDFCLGSRTTKGSGLCIKPLSEWAFTIDITIAGNRIKATRTAESPNIVAIDGLTSGWIEQPDTDENTGRRVLSVERWRVVLGWALFGLPRTSDTHKYNPSFRSLISYFVRRGLDAYSEPFRHFRQQKTWDIQLHVGFLLGLNWEYAAQLQELKDKESALKAMSQTIQTGAMEGFLGSVGELEAERVQLEGQVKEEREAISTFRVHPQYESAQKEADNITRSIHELANQNVGDRRRLARYRDSIADEKPPSDTALDRLYQEIGLVFPDNVCRTLAEAKEFHYRIVENRKEFLAAEVDRLERQIAHRDGKIKMLTEVRASSLEILKNHGALQEMTALQEKHVEAKERLERVRNRISEIKNINSQKREVKVAKTELARVAEQDYDQRRDKWSTAVRIFNENSHALYETPGRLVINITETGYQYHVDIERSGSEGIGKMKIFCFDLMLLQIMSEQKSCVDFVVHDSTLYDGVDSRQRALALERAAEICKQTGTQYICALNSDMVPCSDFSAGFQFDKHVRLTLTDRDPTGSLLGMQYQRPEK